MSLHDDLLLQANQLATCDKGKPRQANLRRAVSTAYYSLFHLLVTDAAALAGSKLGNNAKLKLRRAYAHADMKTICVQYAAATTAANFKPAPIAALLTFPISAQLQNIADTFVSLQEERHEADYDLSVKFSRLSVLTLIGEASAAFLDWKAVRASPNAKILLMDLLVRKGWSRQ